MVRNFLGIAAVLGLGGLAAAQPEAQMRDLYANVRLANAQVVVAPNGALSVAYDLTNVANRQLVLPLTKIGNTPAYWAGARQHWVERVGGGPIAALDRIANPKIAKRGKWEYAAGGWAIPTNGVLPAGGVLRFVELLNTAGFPPGVYTLRIEYTTVDGKTTLQSQAVTFTVR